MGEFVSEKMENIVWPCKESKELCKAKEFNESKGYGLDFKQPKMTEYQTFLSDIHVQDDSNCALISFWQNRVVAICLENQKELAELNAVIIKN